MNSIVKTVPYREGERQLIDTEYFLGLQYMIEPQPIYDGLVRMAIDLFAKDYFAGVPKTGAYWELISIPKESQQIYLYRCGYYDSNYSRTFVFSTLDKAKEYMDKEIDFDYSNVQLKDFYQVEDWEVDYLYDDNGGFIYLKTKMDIWKERDS